MACVGKEKVKSVSFYVPESLNRQYRAVGRRLLDGEEPGKAAGRQIVSRLGRAALLLLIHTDEKIQLAAFRAAKVVEGDPEHALRMLSEAGLKVNRPPAATVGERKALRLVKSLAQSEAERSQKPPGQAEKGASAR